MGEVYKGKVDGIQPKYEAAYWRISANKVLIYKQYFGFHFQLSATIDYWVSEILILSVYIILTNIHQKMHELNVLQ